MKEFAFILGNGKSRLVFEVSDLQMHGVVYGCNRIYQETKVDVLVSTDPGMSQEIISSGYQDSNIHYTREKEIFRGCKSRALQQRWSGFSSGPNALAQACIDGFPYLFLIGFDLISDTDCLNNLYADTENYKSSEDAPAYHRNWEEQITEIIKEFPIQRIIHVNPLLNYTPIDWQQHDNFEVHNIERFKAMINN